MQRISLESIFWTAQPQPSISKLHVTRRPPSHSPNRRWPEVFWGSSQTNTRKVQQRCRSGIRVGGSWWQEARRRLRLELRQSCGAGKQHKLAGWPAWKIEQSWRCSSISGLWICKRETFWYDYRTTWWRWMQQEKVLRLPTGQERYTLSCLFCLSNTFH